jgi:integrase/recombinase XerD
MAGKIRSREKECLNGHGKLTVIEEADIKCDVCSYRPKSYYIDLYWKGQNKISRDSDGHTLDSFKRTHRLLESIRQEIDRGTFRIDNYLPKEIELFRGRTLFPKWLQSKTDVAPTTYREYNRYTKAYFTPYFGMKDLRKITAGDIEDFINSLPFHLSLKTKKNVSIALHNFFAYLHRREAIHRIPVFPIITPPEVPIACISRSDQEKTLEYLKKHPIFSFMVYHPVRPGEARALKVKDFNLQDMTVHIERAFSLKELRSRKNRKDYYLPIAGAFDISVLKNKLPEAFVFTNQEGRPYKAENIRRIWHKACKKAGTPHIKLYNGTRHSTATDALKKTSSLYLVSKLLGHSSMKMTEKYARHDVEILRGITDTTAQVQHIRKIDEK